MRKAESMLSLFSFFEEKAFPLLHFKMICTCLETSMVTFYLFSLATAFSEA
jgi:hypothetical protein